MRKKRIALKNHADITLVRWHPGDIAIADMELQRSYDISTLPTTVVVGPEGGVKDVTVGAMSEWRLARAVR